MRYSISNRLLGLICLLVACLASSPSLAQIGKVRFIDDSDLAMIDLDLKRGCRSQPVDYVIRIYDNPSRGNSPFLFVYGQLAGFDLGVQETPFSPQALNELLGKWRSLPTGEACSEKKEVYAYGGVGTVETSSTTTATNPSAREKYKLDPTQVLLFGRVDAGPLFVTSQTTFAGTPHGSDSIYFPFFPAGSYTATINAGQMYSFVGDAGVTVFHGAGFRVGVFGGYFSENEFLYGAIPGSAAQFSLLSTRWRAGEGGVTIDKMFALGTQPFNFNVTAAALADRLQGGAFKGNGDGFRLSSSLSFPLGPVIGAINGQYAELNASSNNLGFPMTYKTQTWFVGVSASVALGAPSGRK